MFGRLVKGSIVVCVGWLASCANPADTSLAFAQPAAETMARLEGAERLVEGTGMGSLTIAPDETTENTIVITVRRAGDRHKLPCRVTVSAVSEASSRAEVDCHQNAVGNGAARDVATQAITLVMREHVVAAVEDRKYDIDGVANGMMLLIATNGPRLAAAMHSEPPNSSEQE
jgi:hypothetical protein